MLLRYCVSKNHRARFGCIIHSIKKECSICVDKYTCYIRKNFDYYSQDYDTGAICIKCWSWHKRLVFWQKVLKVSPCQKEDVGII